MTNKRKLQIAITLTTLAVASFAFADQVWWAPSGKVCPTYGDQASCEKESGHGCTKHTGSASPACWANTEAR